MSLILHLSDLHLGPPAEWQKGFTDRIGLDRDSGETYTACLRRTLGRLVKRLDADGRTLDLVVVSGDLTKGNKSDGYAEFKSLLADHLEPVLGGDSRIVVVPGNHDVDSGLEVGDPERFRGFFDAVGGLTDLAEVRRPLVVGRDYGDGADLCGGSGEAGAAPLTDAGDALVVAINSANYCWTTESRTETDWEALLFGAGVGGTDGGERGERARSELRSLRTNDIAKVDKRQLEQLEQYLDDAGIAKHSESDARLRIAVIHHPIGVAASREEVKDFDWITNIAEVRNFLYHYGFHLVLHGHKHESFMGWEWLGPPSEDLGTVPWRALALGAPGEFKSGDTVCRLIEVSPDGSPVAGAPRIRVHDIEGVDTAGEVALDWGGDSLSLAQPYVSSSDPDTPWVVKGRSADAVYEQLRDLSATADVPRQVISVVEDPTSTERLPTNYRSTQLDVDELVRWWQLERPAAVRAPSGPRFNHGERLYGETDAIEKAVNALPSSKAFAVLVDAEDAGSKGREFPAFTFVQLQLRHDEYLDVVGSFRKQDLDQWWPVNMAELASIQRHAIKHRPELDSGRQLKPGRLVAIASIGVHEEVVPQMAGTKLDRSIDLHPGWILELAYRAAHPDEQTVGEWERAFEDVGTDGEQGLMVPSIGIDRLLEAMGAIDTVGERSTEYGELISAVKQLVERARNASEGLANSSDPGDFWRRELKRETEAVLDAVQNLERVVST